MLNNPHLGFLSPWENAFGPCGLGDLKKVDIDERLALLAVDGEGEHSLLLFNKHEAKALISTVGGCCCYNCAAFTS